MSTKLKKPPPLKKRHTKPCKFFQIGRCANTAEECNFAHVFVVPGLPLSPVMSPGAGGGGLCQYYRAGQCPSERTCGLRHGHEISSLSLQLNNLQLNSASPLSPTSPYGGDYNYPNPYTAHPAYYNQSWPPSLYKEHPGPGPFGNNGRSPDYQNIQSPGPESPPVSTSTSTDSSALSHLDTPCVDCGVVGALGLSGIEKHSEGNGSSSEERDINVNQVHDCDDVFTEDPQFREHSYIRHQSQLRIMDRDHVIPGVGFGFGGHGPGGYAMPQPSPWNAGGMHYFPQSAGYGAVDHKAQKTTSPPTRSSSRASSRSKNTKYKTKPCKFYTVENGCPNGDSCTFIHGVDIPPVPPIIRSHSKSPSPGSNERYLEPSTTKVVEDNGNPGKDKSQAKDTEPEDNKEKKKNFFPITWRVIGGGVLIGGKRIESPEGSNISQGGDPSPLECTSGTADGKKEFLKPGIVLSRPRSRSTSTPSARPTIARSEGGNDNLFSAESP